LFEKKVKKLTVKDIVEECNITRQAFYYHFEDISDLLQWAVERDSEKIVQECRAKGNIEERIRYFMAVAIKCAALSGTGNKIQLWRRNRENSDSIQGIWLSETADHEQVKTK